MSLTQQEINQILAKIDSVPSELNYHVIVRLDTLSVYYVGVLISKGLGELLLDTININICMFYGYNKSNVYVYEHRVCNLDIPDIYLRKSKDNYGFSEESAFIDNNKITKDFLVHKSDSLFYFHEVEIEDDSNGIKDSDF